jgi:hypothetical protein
MIMIISFDIMMIASAGRVVNGIFMEEEDGKMCGGWRDFSAIAIFFFRGGKGKAAALENGCGYL